MKTVQLSVLMAIVFATGVLIAPTVEASNTTQDNENNQAIEEMDFELNAGDEDFDYYGEERNDEDFDDEDFDFESGDEDDIFGDLSEAEFNAVDAEFDRHYDVVETLYEKYENAKDEATKTAIKAEITQEINTHYTNLKPFVAAESQTLLEEEKVDYINSLDTLDEEFETDYTEDFDDEGEDEFFDEVFGENADWDAIDSVIEKNEEKIDALMTTMEDLHAQGKDLSATKADLKKQILQLQNELLPYVIADGKELFNEEVTMILEYIDNFETYEAEIGEESLEDDFHDEDANYPELKELTDAQYGELDALWEAHEETLDTLYESLGDNPTQQQLKKTKDAIIQEIESVYKKSLPYVTPETVQFLEAEKNEYLEFITEDFA